MHLIFDLDGTLLYTLHDLKNAVNYALEKFGFPKKTLEEIQNAVGDGLRMLIVRSLPETVNHDTIEMAFHEMKRYYKDHCHDETVPYDGIDHMLTELKADGYRLSVVSNKADAMVQRLVKVYFKDWIDFSLGENTQHKRKPDADMVVSAMQKNGFDALYIGDSEVDILTAKNANIPCICVSWGYRSVEHLKKSGAERICSTPDELFACIEAYASNTTLKSADSTTDDTTAHAEAF